MKLLNIDIECRPALAYIWDLRTRYVPPGQIAEPKRLLCFAAKWVGDDEITFKSEWGDGRDEMVLRAWELLDQADAVLHYNGRRFDIPFLKAEFLLAGKPPPSPFVHIDLYLTMRRFGFMSRSLKEISKALGTQGKVEHEGFDLWVKVMNGDRDAQETMERYNIGDILANESLYERIKPWIPNHPNMALHAGDEFACPTCGSESLKGRGMAYSATSSYRRYQCLDCGKWTRETRRNAYTTIKEIAS